MTKPETPTNAAGGSPLERGVRRGAKTVALLALLKNGPMRANEAQALIGNGAYERLVRIGVLRNYQDENPDYAAGVRYSRPMCYWVELANAQYVPHLKHPVSRAHSRKEARLQKAVALLEAAGYVVQAPNASLSGGRRPSA